MHVGGTLTASAGIGLPVNTPGNFARELLVLRGRWLASAGKLEPSSDATLSCGT